MKNNTSDNINSKGFAAVFLLLMLPSLISLLSVTYQLVFLIEFKSEFRFKCINESIKLQNDLLNEKKDGRDRSLELLEKLKDIKSPIKFIISLSDYPEYESANSSRNIQTLAYSLNYEWIESLRLTCGARFIKKEGLWRQEIIYSTGADRY